MQVGSLWLTKSHVSVCTFNENGDMFRLEPGELIVLGDGMLQGDMLRLTDLKWNPLGRFEPKLVSGHQWVRIVLPRVGYVNRTCFNKDSMWLERVS